LVDVAVLNQDDGTIKAHRYLGLPPPSSYFVYDFLAPGSNLRVCALIHATNDIINCKDITAGNNPAEFITLNESWFIMIRKVKENSIIIFNALICEKFCCCASILTSAINSLHTSISYPNDLAITIRVGERDPSPDL
jgi:hypothetical protein